MAETINSRTFLAMPHSLWRRSIELSRERLKPLFEVASSGSKILGVSRFTCFLGILLPLFLTLTSDWIGVLVVFQALTAAMRLRNAPAAITAAAHSSTRLSSQLVKGEYRVL